ncbi:tetratricopeptide repeat protein [Leptospira sp. GIMC2001]|uniref:tetratricopeptide repeat protein n=1 Tax=Leptospira sp. GIMC2001 TaxID=1513297 RepID=UPI002349D103|nr:tetratricopeptide repeat protein [Leptospira sp. GIMC2001]WCL50139.1 tetratricopeptide repeat protein [Leptospira sp. GIMC2001]
MNNDLQLSRIGILIQQGNYKDAEKNIKNLLTNEPNNVELLSLLAEVYLQLSKYDQGIEIIQHAIGLEPTNPDLFYLKARLEISKEKYKEAEQSIQDAISLNPNDEYYYALDSQIKILRKKFELALELANKALAINPENILALNSRSTALLKLNRKKESFDTIDGALREDPNNAYTHANYGWSLLEKNEHARALEHFKEALLHDPNSGYAQLGMVQALKARYFLYRIFLKYSFWMERLSSGGQWAFIIGFYVLTRILKSVAKSYENLYPYLIPIVVIMGVLAFSTWIITPISNLFLRLNRYGQFLLDSKEKLSSNLVGISLLIGIASLLIGWYVEDMRFIPIGIFGIVMMAPLGVMFSASKSQTLLVGYTILLAILGALSLYFTFTEGEIFNGASMLFVFGFVGFNWLSNFILIKESNPGS